MSEYPYGYPFQGQTPQQHHPTYQPYGAYPPTAGYPAHPSQQPHQPQPYLPTTANYYATSHSAYDFNASSIPGLGTPSNGPSFPNPYSGSWDQPGYAASVPPTQPSAYSQSSPSSSKPFAYQNFQGQASVPQNPRPAPLATSGQQNEQKQSDFTPQPKQQPKEQPKEPPKAQLDETESQDEGEISDGYFDDLYDDVPNQPSAVDDHVAASTNDSADAAADGLDQEPNFYDTDMEEAPPAEGPIAAVSGGSTQETTKTVEQAGRNHSRSYSPHLSPTEVQQDNLSTLDTSGDVHGSDETAADHEPVNHTAQPGSSPGVVHETVDQISGLEKGDQTAVAVKGSHPADIPPRLFASLSEAHNEAKKAILRLLPHGVKYQTYIEEGIDGKVIKDLFTQLNLPSEPATAVSSEKPVTTQEKKNQEPNNQVSQPTQVDSMAKKQEERKDRIARLLAEKKAKAAVAGSSAGAATDPKKDVTPISTVLTPAARPPITRAEKDLLLQQKIEALHKAREAKKLVTASASAPTPKPEAQKPNLTQEPSAVTQSPVRPSSTNGTPVSSATGPVPLQNALSKSTTPQSPFSAAPSPGVSSLSSAPRTAQQVNQRKRPVAADFMDYPPSAVKRPSLANRQDSSLVISVSDDEDDDDDVEMEVDSATEDSPVPSQQTLTLPRRGPSIRDYPPLTNMNSARQVSSPVHGTSTSGSRNANVDLKAREKEIADLRRKIQEAEARAKAKPKKGSVTPQTPSTVDDTPMEQVAKPSMHQVISSTDINDKSVPLAQSLEKATAVNTPESPSVPLITGRQLENEQRARVSSAQPPVKSAKMAEKAERLKRMQEEMLRLQTEIDEDMAEEQRAEGSAEPETSEGMQVSSEGKFDQSYAPEAVPTPNPSMEHMASDQEAQPVEIVSVEAPEEELETSLAAPDLETQSPAVSGADERHDNGPDAVPTPEMQGSFADGDPNASDDYEPPEPINDGCAEVDVVTFDQTPAEIANNSGIQAGLELQNNNESMTISTGSDLSLDPANEQRPETVADDTLSTPQTSFAPYESPLRYFHAFRFHPKYSDGVSGGLKSLTYSNRIDPNKEMCPDEWEGNDCPRGEACQFQHFQNIIAPDNEIILELGSSDEFTGEQKKIFNNGLREMVSSFQKSKVRDFRTIAQAIVEFRRKFLGDSSKVLHLEGVSI